MPTASIDFTLASFAMIVLVMGAIFGVNIVVSPYIEDNSHDPDRYHQIGKFMLLSQGKPSNWGTASRKIMGVVMISFSGRGRDRKRWIYNKGTTTKQNYFAT